MSSAFQNPIPQTKQGAEDSGRYFRYMAEFIGFTEDDAATIKQTKPIIDKHLPEIVGKFYAHLLRYPPTRKFFLRADGTVDQDYVELRMRHLTNFWLRTASGEYDETYARYVDYVGRAHTSRGADPRIYIAERYVIGQVGFVQHAITEALTRELQDVDEYLEDRAAEAWSKLMMVILEMLSRAYGAEREAETFDLLVPVDQQAVTRLAAQAFEHEQGEHQPVSYRDVAVARAADIPDGERKIVRVGDLSIGVFHHRGEWYALHNSCLHRGGPVCTGSLDADTLTCPWHGFQYDVGTGKLLVDPNAGLEIYPVTIRDGEVHLQVPEMEAAPRPALERPTPAPESMPLRENEFRVGDLPPGKTRLVHLSGQPVAVYNIDGVFYATQDECTHAGGPLSEGQLDGHTIICPIHGSCFDVTTGAVLCGPADEPLKMFQVTVQGDIGRVTMCD